MEQNSAARLPLFSIPPMYSPDHPGMSTPPIYSPASIPFRWEEEPGKPRFTNTTTAVSKPTDFARKSLELPPRLLLMDTYNSKLPSPTTVLDGPYYPYMSRPRSKSSSFRMMSKECYNSYSPEKVEIGDFFIRKRWFGIGSWRRKALRGKRDIVYPSFVGRESEFSGFSESFSSRFRRNGSFSSLSQVKPHFWTTVCEGLKQVVPWKSKKLKSEAYF